MDMEFKDPARRRRFATMAIGVALAAIAGFGAFTFASSGTRPAEEVPTQAVLVAARDVAARTPLSPEDVTVRQVPIDEALSQTYREAGLVIGRVTAVPIYADQQITPNLFASAAANTDWSILGSDEEVTGNSPYWRAVAVDIPPERAVGGEIQAGQHVDLVISVDIDILFVDDQGQYQKVDTATEDGLQSGKTTKITMQDLEVLKADAPTGIYLLKVSLHQAEQIYHVTQVAPDAFSLALRPDEDNRVVDTRDYGETTDRMIMTYLFRVPQLVDITALLEGATPVEPVPSAAPSPSPAP